MSQYVAIAFVEMRVCPLMSVTLLNLLTLKSNVVETARVKAPERVRWREFVLTYQAFCAGGAAGFRPGLLQQVDQAAQRRTK